MNLYYLFKEWDKEDMHKILEAKLAFVTTLIIACCLGYFASSWRYAGIINGLEERLRIEEEIKNLELEEKSKYREELFKNYIEI